MSSPVTIRALKCSTWELNGRAKSSTAFSTIPVLGMHIMIIRWKVLRRLGSKSVMVICLEISRLKVYSRLIHKRTPERGMSWALNNGHLIIWTKSILVHLQKIKPKLFNSLKWSLLWWSASVITQASYTDTRGQMVHPDGLASDICILLFQCLGSRRVLLFMHRLVVFPFSAPWAENPCFDGRSMQRVEVRSCMWKQM